MKRTRQPKTLEFNLDECNLEWERVRVDNKPSKWARWACTIDECGQNFARKALLMHHRGAVHGLSEYESNIPDQRERRQGETLTILLASNCLPSLYRIHFKLTFIPLCLQVGVNRW